MRVLVDTSVWSRALRSHEDPAAVRLEQLLWRREDLMITGLILQEVLQAFRSEDVFERVRSRLEPFTLLDLQREDFVEAARLHRSCASKGLSVSTTDCQIAYAAIQFDCQLMTVDADFERIAEVSELRLF